VAERGNKQIDKGRHEKGKGCGRMYTSLSTGGASGKQCSVVTLWEKEEKAGRCKCIN